MVPRSQNSYPQLHAIYDYEYDYEYGHEYKCDYDHISICGEISWLISTKLYAYPHYLCLGFVDQKH